ncbi:restriction endonuclease subunit S [Hydrogenophaga sp.]|uniref:restriction endonuclease subunit S n=1 Tax=Hydrogenophaga sp. TaxID=1904254 RepID=UPI0025B879B9|nr:restriction endonuclease subunit S [Hydrogenophaga sp.]
MREARLGDVVASMKNGMYKPASEYADDGIPCLRMYNIEAGSIVWRDIKRMKVTPQEYADYGLHEGDLLVNRVNSRELVGKAAVIPGALEPSVFESKNIRVRLDTSKALPKFINYQLFARGSKHFANNAQQVVGMASISQGQLSDFPIVLTDVDEQRRIVAEIEKQFSRLDEAVANLQRVKANLKRYKAAVLKAAVEGRLVETEASLAHREGRSYETGNQLLQRILEQRRIQWAGRGKYKEPEFLTNVSRVDIPEGWTWASLEQLHLQIADVDHRMPKGQQDGVPYVSTKDFLDDEGIDFAGAKRISSEDYEALCRKVKPERGDVLLSRYGTVGEVRAVTVDSPFQASYSVAILKPVRENFPVRFLIAALRSEVVTAQIKRDVRATAQPDLGLAHIRKFVVPLPPIGEQVRIVEELDRCLSVIREVEAEVAANLLRAHSLRKATLAKAFMKAD